MVIGVASLTSRSPASLRSFVRAQRMSVRRFPDSVGPATPSDKDYWRFLVRRVPLEGICAHYQSYDASGDENDWNLNIVPDTSHAWLLDPAILYALSLASGAPHPVDACDVKCYDGARVIECELTPDDGLYDKFTSAGLPISSGGTWPDGAANKGLGPTGRRVGVYGAFVGDYGHGGRPEIHPFDALWRRFHGPRSASVSWDLGVFQDDSNRFNSDWSEAPIDIEFRVPFCVNFPVTRRTSVTRRVRFTLARSPLCSVVGKKTRTGPGPSVLRETFSGRTVRLNPSTENRLEVSVEDSTGLSGTPFGLSFGDLRFTRSRLFGLFTIDAWLSGALVVRVAVDQDGFAYWNLAGPNSTNAADAPDDLVPEAPTDELTALAASRGPRPPPPFKLRILEASPVVSTGDNPTIAAELVVEEVRDKDNPRRHTVTVRPRLQPLLYLDSKDPTSAVELESFDLFAQASIGVAAGSPIEGRADVAAGIGQLAGSHRLGQVVRSVPASLQIDDFVTIDFETRYAPFRDGVAQGEERSLLSERLTRAVTNPADCTCDVVLTSVDGGVRRIGGDRGYGADLLALTVEADAGRQQLSIGPLGGEPVTIQVNALFEDAFGLSARSLALVTNYRVVEARSWLETAAGISLTTVRASRDEAERAAIDRADPDAVARTSMLDALAGVLAGFDELPAVPARQVAGTIRLASRIATLSPGVRLG